MKKNLGVTLVALVITIIILLILAGISINLIIGPNGIFSQTEIAVNSYKNSENNEAEILTSLENRLATLTGNGNTENNINKEDLKTEIKQEVKEELMEELKSQIISSIYPVGSIYISTEISTKEEMESKFGGTWEQYAEGRTLIGVGTGKDSNSIQKTFAVNSQGGEYNHTLTVSEMPSHSHAFSNGGLALVLDASFSHSSMAYSSGFAIGASNGSWWNNHHKNVSAIANSGNSRPHNNTQPYIATYMWKRVN